MPLANMRISPYCSKDTTWVERKSYRPIIVDRLNNEGETTSFANGHVAFIQPIRVPPVTLNAISMSSVVSIKDRPNCTATLQKRFLGDHYQLRVDKPRRPEDGNLGLSQTSSVCVACVLDQHC